MWWKGLCAPFPMKRRRSPWYLDGVGSLCPCKTEHAFHGAWGSDACCQTFYERKSVVGSSILVSWSLDGGTAFALFGEICLWRLPCSTGRTSLALRR